MSRTKRKKNRKKPRKLGPVNGSPGAGVQTQGVAAPPAPQMRPLAPPKEPIDELPAVLAGPAKRIETVWFGAKRVQMPEQLGICWICPGCNRQRAIFDNKVYFIVNNGEDIIVRCGDCGKQARANKSHVEVFTEGQANEMLLQMARAWGRS